MSQTYSIICPELKLRLWIGQGNFDEMLSFYANPGYIIRLKDFLNLVQDKELKFLCDDSHDFIYDYNEFGELPEDE
jgi:hypothetical protein